MNRWKSQAIQSVIALTSGPEGWMTLNQSGRLFRVNTWVQSPWASVLSLPVAICFSLMSLVVLPAPGWAFPILSSLFPFFSPLLSSVPPSLHPSFKSSSTPLYLSPSLPPSLHPSWIYSFTTPYPPSGVPPSIPPSLPPFISPSIHPSLALPSFIHSSIHRPFLPPSLMCQLP